MKAKSWVSQKFWRGPNLQEWWVGETKCVSKDNAIKLQWFVNKSEPKKNDGREAAGALRILILKGFLQNRKCEVQILLSLPEFFVRTGLCCSHGNFTITVKGFSKCQAHKFGANSFVATLSNQPKFGSIVHSHCLI